MAGGSVYQDDELASPITDINVTPFVDVVLVLLIIFIATARLIVARGIEIDKPPATTGGEVQSELRVQVDRDSHIYVNGIAFDNDAAAIARIKLVTKPMKKPKAIIAGDQHSAYGGVMRAIDLVKRAGIDLIALENIAPSK